MASEIEFRLLNPSEVVRPAPDAEGAGTESGGVGFGQQLGQAIERLDQVHGDADGQAQMLAQGGGNLHEVALAFEKADVAMRLATKVRNKLVEAYNEIMRMSV